MPPEKSVYSGCPKKFQRPNYATDLPTGDTVVDGRVVIPVVIDLDVVFSVEFFVVMFVITAVASVASLILLVEMVVIETVEAVAAVASGVVPPF